MPVGPEELTLQALSPEQRVTKISYMDWHDKQFVGLQGLDDCKEYDNGERDKLQFLVL